MSPTQTLFTRHGVAELAPRLGALGVTRVLILSSPRRRFVDEIVAALADFDPEVFDGAAVHVPAEVVDAAAARLRAIGADGIIAVGGGSAIGLGKALRLAHAVPFVAIPTTYAGSEMTTMYGITRGGEKQTGRDDRVRPDLVLYDAALTADMPLGISVQSLCNSIAHVASVLATGSLDAAARHDALAGAADAVHAIEDLLLAPRSTRFRDRALRAASGCATAFERGKSGAQHALAHALGGAFGVEHAGLHAALLPHFLAALRGTAAEVVGALEERSGRPDLDAHLFDLLARAGAPLALAALGITLDELRALLAKRPELPAAIALDALRGLRPPGRRGRLDLGSEPQALLSGPRPEDAAHVVIALHGRGADAGTILRRYREIVGHARDVCVLGLRASDGAERWYGVKYSEPGAGRDPEVLAAIARVETALADVRRRAPQADVFLAGFSQGACLALEVAARHAGELAGVLAPCGARIGRSGEWAPSARSFERTRIVLGAAAHDPWIAAGDVATTATWFGDAGASVTVVGGPGDAHDITFRQRAELRRAVARAIATPASGFGNTHECAAIAGALPVRQNSPRRPPLGLYPEQINGTGFTAPRADNHRSWLYRVRPSAQRRAYAAFDRPRITGTFEGAPEINLAAVPAAAIPDDARDFVDGLTTICGAGSAALRRGYAFHGYAANRSMEQRAFYSADGDLVILPEHGTITLLTELGALEVEPGSIALIPRGMLFSVLLHGTAARGYVAEAFGRAFRLPDRGPIGANGLADARHFRTPTPWYEDRLAIGFEVVGKLGGKTHVATQDHSPYDVVAWHGNLAPYGYDLDAFSPSGNIRFDHGDPSIHTVLSAPLDEHGAHTLDLVVFPPRWDVTTGTFRPPFFHRNGTSEINGILRDASPAGSPFQPGMTFLTPAMTPHGVSSHAVEQSRALDDQAADAPLQLGATSLWFQLESALAPVLTPWAATERLPEWTATWGSHPAYFSP